MLAATSRVKSRSAHGGCRPAAVTQCVFHHWGWHSSLWAPPLGGMSRRISKTRVGRVPCLRGAVVAPRAAGLGWDLAGLFESSFQGTCQALTRGWCRLYSFWCQLSRDPSGTALVSAPLLPASSLLVPGGRYPSSTLGIQLAEHPGASLPPGKLLSHTVQLLMASCRHSGFIWLPPGPTFPL